MPTGLLLILVLAASCGEAPAAAPDAAVEKDLAAADPGATAVDAGSDGVVIPDGGAITVAVDTVIGPWAEACKKAPKICDDGNPCTDDGCDNVTGCTAVVKACSDEDACTIDKCDIKTGSCSHLPQACEDNNACTEGSCVKDQGCAFKAVTCGDGDNCTSDGCSPQIGCTHAPLDCNDGMTCTQDACEPASGCVHKGPTGTAKCCEIPSDCEDGDVCTVHQCLVGLCQTVAAVGCCKVAADCDDGNDCTNDQCGKASGQCGHVAKVGLGCCAADLDCDDGTPCTFDKCIDNKCGHETTCCTTASDCAGAVSGVQLCVDATCTANGCAALPKLEAATKQLPAACCTPNVASTGFEETDSWLPTLVPSAYGQWTLAPFAGKSGRAAQFKPKAGGVPGGGSVAQLRLPEIALPIGAAAKVTFSYTGKLGAGDIFRLRGTTSVGSFYLWQGGGATGWATAQIDLTGLAARLATRKVSLTWEILNGKGNDAGLNIDDVAVTSTCKPKPCSVDVQCNDNAGYSNEKCSDGACVYSVGKEYCEQSGPVCDDGNPCTTDYCGNFACQHAKINNCCQKTADCDDKHPCTIDVCQGASCVFTKLAPEVCCEVPLDCDDKKTCTLDTCPQVGLPCAHTLTAPGCCDINPDCDDSDKCTEDKCAKNTCSHKNLCCATVADCDDGDKLCTDDSCLNGFCQWKKLIKPECCIPVIFETDFESGMPSYLQVTGSSKVAFWQSVTGKQSHGGKGALWYGDIAKNNFDDGQINNGIVATVPAVTLPAGGPITLSFWLWMDTEQGPPYDELTVEVSLAGGAPEVLWKKSQKGISMQQWTEVKVDLSKFAGGTVTVQLHFDTIDQIGNSGQGVFVDDLALKRSCD